MYRDFYKEKISKIYLCSRFDILCFFNIMENLSINVLIALNILSKKISSDHYSILYAEKDLFKILSDFLFCGILRKPQLYVFMERLLSSRNLEKG